MWLIAEKGRGVVWAEDLQRIIGISGEGLIRDTDYLETRSMIIYKMIGAISFSFLSLWYMFSLVSMF